MTYGAFLLVLLGNLWIWRIVSFSFPLSLFVFASSIFLYLSIKSKNKNYKFLFVVFFTLLLFFQWKTTTKIPLTYLSNDQQRIQHMRLKEYPPVYIRLADKTLWIPLAWWFEGRGESIAFFRILDNFSEIIDPNLYFFANHPRERVGINEFEKFPYILLPFFIYGILVLLEQKRLKPLLLAFTVHLVMLSIIGSQNFLGNFSIFPLLTVVTSSGLGGAFGKVRHLSKNRKNILMIGFLVVYILVFLQLISYELFSK
jgi:hypothetical protein